MANKKKKERSKTVSPRLKSRKKPVHVNASQNELEWLAEINLPKDPKQVQLVVDLPNEVYEYLQENEAEWDHALQNGLRSALEPAINPDSIKEIKYRIQVVQPPTEAKV
ncbi:hypothetical protein FHS19_003015 [Paenibacillus rhizosphaerae]|uniref:Uncharacterized protein n=1 Tax=Paenibacillus rhizosphaerae TaxID=297318 RepID=A0A839TP64_9BACL|nr:hypothetical protein [Paenibacillus rhizosphaerae]MBB3128361.1 hypothetical protein [Paenibacillus rhizosphaerae]